jgi:hypothetical protein
VDTFAYQVSDGQSNSGLATVSITVSNPIQVSSVVLLNNLVTVTWTSMAGKKYRLQYRDTFADGAWTNVLPGVNATGPTATETNAVDVEPHRIYRVECLGN